MKCRMKKEKKNSSLVKIQLKLDRTVDNRNKCMGNFDVRSTSFNFKYKLGISTSFSYLQSDLSELVSNVHTMFFCIVLLSIRDLNQLTSLLVDFSTFIYRYFFVRSLAQSLVIKVPHFWTSLDHIIVFI